ncbi:hypothetical protein IWW36_003214 [Coemansia brasiliensis]|uniref:Uncharacterized protein n=1 Tax=Coemansia brasiliensis TaxID=2650707 RepID=A0A9W8ID82_9FUNG|nr:hypothetical protein IWW36_003214 [Coemansia brasiliensis]
MTSLEALPQDIFNRIALALDVTDLAALALTSRRLCSMARDDELWLERVAADFGDRALVVSLLAEAGVDIAELADCSPDLVPWRPALVPNCRGKAGMQCYRDRLARAFPASDDERLARAKHGESEIDQVKQLLRDGPPADDVLCEAAFRLLRVQEWFPTSAECYYLWALICFMRNALFPALQLLDIGQAVNSDFGPLHELRAEVQATVDGVFGSGNETPLLNPTCSEPSSQLTAALAAIFRRFDCDRDGVLSAKELGALIRVTNGQPVPPAAISQIIHTFGGPIQTHNSRKVAGWDLRSLCSFYVAQSLQDPQETRQDLEKFGFDPQSLKKR